MMKMMARLAQLLADPDLRRRLGASGALHVGRFQLGLITRQWENNFVRLTLAQAAGLRSLESTAG